MIEKSSPSFEQELFSLYSYGLPATSLRAECFNKLIGASSEREKREKLQLGMAAAPDYPVWLLKQAQEQAMVCLTHGEYVAIGYASEEESSLHTNGLFWNLIVNGYWRRVVDEHIMASEFCGLRTCASKIGKSWGKALG